MKMILKRKYNKIIHISFLAIFLTYCLNISSDNLNINKNELENIPNCERWFGQIKAIEFDSLKVRLDPIFLKETKSKCSVVDFQSIYSYGNLKLAIGSYKNEKQLVDDINDYGLRLFLLNEGDSIFYSSKGMAGTWKVFSSFYYLGNDNELLILLEKAEEEFYGIEVFLLKQNQIRKIGSIDFMAFDEFESIPTRETLIICKRNKDIEITFSSEYVWEFLKEKNEYEKVNASNLKYIFNGNDFFLKR